MWEAKTTKGVHVSHFIFFAFRTFIAGDRIVRYKIIFFKESATDQRYTDNGDAVATKINVWQSVLTGERLNAKEHAVDETKQNIERIGMAISIV